MQVAEQGLISTMIRSAIDTLDRVEHEAAIARKEQEALQALQSHSDHSTSIAQDDSEDTRVTATPATSAHSSGRVVLGSGLSPITFEQLQNEHALDTAYNDILRKFNRFLRSQLGLTQRTSPLNAETQVSPAYWHMSEFI